jgi:hypothetical protein
MQPSRDTVTLWGISLGISSYFGKIVVPAKNSIFSASLDSIVDTGVREHWYAGSNPALSGKPIFGEAYIAQIEQYHLGVTGELSVLSEKAHPRNKSFPLMVLFAVGSTRWCENFGRRKSILLKGSVRENHRLDSACRSSGRVTSRRGRIRSITTFKIKKFLSAVAH